MKPGIQVDFILMPACGCDMSYLSMAIANYILKKSKEKNAKISKSKLQNIIISAHLDYLKKFGKPLISEKINLMHFGFIIPSISEYFGILKYDEDINARNYTKCEEACKVGLRKIILGNSVSDPLELRALTDFLDEKIAEFSELSTRESIVRNIKPGSVWHQIAFRGLKGNHLIEDFTEVSNKFLIAVLDGLRDSLAVN